MRHTPGAAAPTCIIPDEEPLPLPPEVQHGLTYVPRLGWQQLDAFALAAQAQLLFARAAPKVRGSAMSWVHSCPNAAAFCVPERCDAPAHRLQPLVSPDRGASAQAPRLLQPTVCVT